jgi:hypothetical protein
MIVVVVEAVVAVVVAVVVGFLAFDNGYRVF